MQMPKRHRGFIRRGGFTLIETLVVVAIIGLLASIVLASLRVTRDKSHDARRKSDMQTLSQAIQIYAIDHNDTYPNCTSFDTDPSWVKSSDPTWQTSCLATALVPYYLPALPVDPTNTSGQWPWVTGSYSYAYASTGNLKKYDLVTQLENTTDPQTCQYKAWRIHTSSESLMCGPWSPYLVNDH